MCNMKGWDVLFGPDGPSIEQHFCRVYDDCGHVDNTLEDAVAVVAEWHENQARLWRSGEHPTVKYYKDES